MVTHEDIGVAVPVATSEKQQLAESVAKSGEGGCRS